MREHLVPDPSSRWAADAVAYDSWFDRPWGRYASRVEHDLLLAAIGPVDGLDVCDAGGGTDRFTARLEADGARVVAVDRDPIELAVARTRVRGDLIEADVHHLPFPDGQIDVTIAVTSAQAIGRQPESNHGWSWITRMCETHPPHRR